MSKFKKAIYCSLSAVAIGCIPSLAFASDDLSDQVAALTKQVKGLQSKITAMQTDNNENFLNNSHDDKFSAAAVTTSPTLGLRSAHHGQDLVVNFSSLNEDLRLLEQRSLFQKQRNVEDLSRPLVELSGVIRGGVQYKNAFDGSNSTDITLIDAEIDAFIEASRWVSGFISFAYDSGMPAYNSTVINPGSGYNKLSWSNVYLRRAFITVGDLTQSPVYGSIGQMYMPFGKYSSWLVSPALTKQLGKTSGRAIDVGFKGEDYVATAFVMHGDARDTNENTINDHINVWGGNVEKTLQLGKDNKLTVGAGYSNNIADSEGVLSVLGTTTAMYGALTYNVQNLVPAYDLYAKLEFADNWAVSAEYIDSTKDIVSSSVVGNLGSPSALHLELDHFAYVGALPLSMAIGYGHTSDFKYFPQDSYQAAVSTYIWKDTIQSLEFRHLKAYAGTESIASFSRNYLTAVFSMYF